MYGYIYKTTNLVNDKIYVGKKEKNVFDPTYYGSGLLLTQDLKAYGFEKFKIEILQWCRTLESLNAAEKRWIKKLKAQNSEIGYNISDGGDGGNLLRNLSEDKKQERAEKIANKLRNKKFSKERVQKMREAALKYYANPENKEKWKKRNEQRLKDNPNLSEKISKSQKERFNKNPELKIKKSQNQKQKWTNINYVQKQKQTRRSKDYLDKMSNLHNNLNKIRIYKDNKELLVDSNVLNNYLTEGWIKGRKPFSEETKQKMKEAALKRNKKG